MRYRYLYLCLVLMLCVGIASAQTDPIQTTTETPDDLTAPAEATEAQSLSEEEATAAPEYTTYVVQRGDTLARIAARFNTTATAISRLNGIINTNLIYTGQTLRIPLADAETTPEVPATTTPTEAPTQTETAMPPVTDEAPPTGSTTYTVRSGDTLAKIATRFNTTVAELVKLNQLANINVIYPGQEITVPNASATPAPTEAPDNEGGTDAGASAQFDYGVTIITHSDNTQDNSQQLATLTQELGVMWVKIDVKWQDLEPVQGEIDFSALDATIDALDAAGLQLLLTVSAAPDWARTSIDEEGPADDFDAFNAFISALATHYQGKVDAYQIWNEPNLRREWNSSVYEIRADHYVTLLQGAYENIKRISPDTLVIAAGLAPTGFNDGINAIDDRVYLQDMYSNGVINYSDAVAAHPGGWANPPDAECCTKSTGVETHYESPSFFFKDTLEDYREIMVRNQDQRPLWVTKFGWGTSEDTQAPGADYVYITYTDLAEQAIYTPRAFEIGKALGYVGPMFLYNLNGCTAAPLRAEQCFNSLLSPDGETRPVFSAVAALDKSESATIRATQADTDDAQ